MKKSIILFLFFYTIAFGHLNSQENTVQTILKHSNEYYKYQESGKIVIYQFKSKNPFSEDTTRYSGELFFWNDSFDIHGNNKFLVLSEGEFVTASDLDYYYYNFSNSIQKTATQNPDAEKELKSSSQRSNLLPKFITKQHTGILDTALVEKAIILRRAEDNNGTVVIEVRDSFPNTMTDKGARKNVNLDLRIYINSESYAIAKLEEWIHVFEQPQYRAIEISEVIPINPKEVLYCDSLFASLSDINIIKFEDTQNPNENLSSVRKGDILKDFRLPAINSDNTSLAMSDYDDGLIILDFWYKACYPCLLAMPKLEEIHQNYKKNKVFVLGINPFDKNGENLKSFLDKRNISYPTLIDEHSQIVKYLKIHAFPTIIVIDAKTKKVLDVFEGHSKESEKRIQEIIEANIK
jgi:thiol-disulfide isomerase/thioredoxin